MTHYAGRGIIPQDPSQFLVRRMRAVSEDNEACVLGKADTDTTAVMKRHPGRAGCGI
jgi:hypothetical protein